MIQTKTISRTGITLLLFLLTSTVSIVSQAQTLPPLKESVTWKKLNLQHTPLGHIGMLEPVHSSDIEESWWSIGCETLDRDYSIFKNYEKYVGETGVGYARIQSGWAKCETEKGVYNFEWLDEIVQGLSNQGVKPWICLCYGNPLYSDDGADLNANIFPEGPVMDAWNKYVEAVVKRYKGIVTMYEVWNEPDGGKGSPESYAVLFKNTARSIKKIDKNVKIAALGICSPDKPYIRESLAKMQEIDAIKYVDYITYHAYWEIPENVRPAVIKLREIAKGFNQQTKLLQGETGCPATLEYGHALKNKEWSEYSQLKWDLRQMAVQFGMGVPSSVFTMVDLNYGWMMQSFGLIRMNLKHIPQYKRPKFYAVQNMASVITRKFEPDNMVKVESKCEREIECVGLKKNDQTVGALLWFGGRKPDENLEKQCVDLTVKGINLKHAVYVDLATGKVYSLASTVSKGANLGNEVKFVQLPLWDAPILIINRSEVKFTEKK